MKYIPIVLVLLVAACDSSKDAETSADQVASDVAAEKQTWHVGVDGVDFPAQGGSMVIAQSIGKTSTFQLAGGANMNSIRIKAAKGATGTFTPDTASFVWGK